MNTDLASAVSPPLAAGPAIPDSPSIERVVYYARRAVAWTLDGLVLAGPLFLGLVVLWVFSTLIAGGAIGVGLATGDVRTAGTAAIVSMIVAFVAVHATLLGIPLLYLTWAVHRGGAHAGQTLGQQVMKLKVTRVDSPGHRVSTRLMIGRAVLLYLVGFGSMAAAAVAGLAADSWNLGNLVWVVAVGAVLWLAPQGRLPHDRLSGTRMADWTAAPIASGTPQQARAPRP